VKTHQELAVVITEVGHQPGFRGNVFARGFDEEVDRGRE
jgi:hypothetical protein